MRITCEYCGGYLQDTDECCPNCAAVNKNVMRSADGIPKTIEQLKAFAEEKKLPLKQMRFFIGENITEPRAFGIYKDEYENYVVYKNKSDGTRIVRYEGKDEAYAVNELYQKMRSEVMEQKAHQAVNSVHGKQTSTSSYNQNVNQNYQQRDSHLKRTTINTGNAFSARRRKKRFSLVKVIFLIIILVLFLSRVRNQFANAIIYSFIGGDSSYESDYDYNDYGGYDYDDYDYGDYDYDDDDYDSWGDDWDDDDWDWDYGGDSWDSGYTDWDTDW